MLKLTYGDIYQQSSAPSHLAGSIAEDPNGRLWMYVQASEALRRGDVVRPAGTMGIVRDADVDAASAADTYQVTATGDFATSLLVDASFLSERNLNNKGHQYFLEIDAGAAQGQVGAITARTDDNNVNVWWWNSTDGRIDTALTTSSDHVVWTWSRVAACDAAADLAVGVAQFAITDEYWFWLAYKWGPFIARIDTDATAIQTDDRGLIPTTTTGECGGLTGTGTTAEIAAMFGRSIIDVTGDGQLLCGLHCDWTCPFVRNAGYISTFYAAASTQAAWPRLD